MAVTSVRTDCLRSTADVGPSNIFAPMGTSSKYVLGGALAAGALFLASAPAFSAVGDQVSATLTAQTVSRFDFGLDRFAEPLPDQFCEGSEVDDRTTNSTFRVEFPSSCFEDFLVDSIDDGFGYGTLPEPVDVLTGVSIDGGTVRLPAELTDLSISSEEIGSAGFGQVFLFRSAPSGCSTLVFEVIPNGSVSQGLDLTCGSDGPDGDSTPPRFLVTFPDNGADVDQGPLRVSGTFQQSTNVVFTVLTDQENVPGGIDCNNDGAVDGIDDLNSDGVLGTYLDCQIATNIALAAQLTDSGRPATLSPRVQYIAYGADAVSADLSPEDGIQTTIVSRQNLTGDDRLPDLDQALITTRPGEVGEFTPIAVAPGDDPNSVLREILDGPPRDFVYLHVSAQGEIDDSLLSQLQLEGTTVIPISTGLVQACGADRAGGVISSQFGTPCLEGSVGTSITDFSVLPTSIDSTTVSVDGEPPQEATFDAAGNFSADIFLTAGSHEITISSISNGAVIQEETLTVNAVTGIEYVHLGDSWAAGAGSGATPENGIARCFQSEFGLGFNLFSSDFPVAGITDANRINVACSGAQSVNILNSTQDRGGASDSIGSGFLPSASSENVTRPAQLDSVNLSSDLVTIQGGGNDLALTPLITRCATADVTQNCFDEGFITLESGRELNPNEFFDARLAATVPVWNTVFSELRDESGPQTPVVALGYSLLFEQDFGFLACVFTRIDFNADERRGFRALGVELNAGLRSSAGSAGIHFVDIQRQFEGHNACADEDEWVRGEAFSTTNAIGASFHPNREGLSATASITSCYLNGLVDSGSWPVNQLGLPVNPIESIVPLPSEALDCFDPNAFLPNNRAFAFAQGPEPGTPLTEAEAAEVAALEFDIVSIGTLGQITQTAPCSDLVPGQQVFLVANGFQPGTSVSLRVADSQTDGARIVDGAAVADSDGEVVISTVVPAELLIQPTQDLVAVGFEVSGIGQTGAPRRAAEVAEADLTSSQCREQLIANGEVAEDQGQAPLADSLNGVFDVDVTVLPRLINIEDLSLDLVDADSDATVASLVDGASFDLDELGLDEFSIEAFGPVETESVVFELNGPVENIRTENVSRYALFANRGDNLFGRDALAGEYSLTVRAFDGNNGRGELLAETTITFTFVN